MMFLLSQQETDVYVNVQQKGSRYIFNSTECDNLLSLGFKV